MISFAGIKSAGLVEMVGLLRMVVVDDGKAEEFRDSSWYPLFS